MERQTGKLSGYFFLPNAAKAEMSGICGRSARAKALAKEFLIIIFFLFFTMS